MIDPVLQHAASAALAIVLLTGAFQKLRDLMGFEMAIENYALVPLTLVKPIALLLPAWEIVAGGLLVVQGGPAAAQELLVFVTPTVVVEPEESDGGPAETRVEAFESLEPGSSATVTRHVPWEWRPLWCVDNGRWYQC